MSEDRDQPLLEHLLALRRALVRSVVAIVALLPLGFLAAPHVIRRLVAWCIPKEAGTLHYFAPMEVFIIELEFGLFLALAASFPWCLAQIWEFVAPGLREAEKRYLGFGIFASTVLFVLGGAFCVGFILPILMKFSASFAGDGIVPTLGIASFLRLAGGITLAFGVMFQIPMVVLMAVRLGLVRASRIRSARPYVWTLILILSALLTPPDIASQCMLALPTGLLFEVGLFIASHMDCIAKSQTKTEEL